MVWIIIIIHVWSDAWRAWVYSFSPIWSLTCFLWFERGCVWCDDWLICVNAQWDVSIDVTFVVANVFCVVTDVFGVITDVFRIWCGHGRIWGDYGRIWCDHVCLVWSPAYWRYHGRIMCYHEHIWCDHGRISRDDWSVCVVEQWHVIIDVTDVFMSIF